MSALPPNWTEYTTDDGKPYYHNAVTGVTQWEKPVPEPPSAPGGNPSDVYQVTFEDLDLGVKGGGAPSGTMDLSGKEKGGEGKGGEVKGPVSTFSIGDSKSTTDSKNTGAQGPSKPASAQSTTGTFGGGERMSMLQAARDPEGAMSRLCWCCDIRFMQQFFDVTTQDVVKRVGLALLPFKAVNTQGMSDFRAKPDFYGPFWIATTVIIFLAATGNYAQLFTGEMTSTDINFFWVAAGVVYGFLIAVPAIAWLMSKFVAGAAANSVKWIQLTCVYGYSLFVMIPVSLLCLIPSTLARWIVVIAGLVDSLVFILMNLYGDLESSLPRFRFILIAFIGSAQVALFLTYRIYFFINWQHK